MVCVTHDSSASWDVLRLALLTLEIDKASGNIFSSFSAGLTAGVCMTRNDATHDAELTM